MIVRPKSIQKLKSICIRLNEKERKLFKNACWKEGKNVSTVYRELIKNYIKRTLPDSKL